MRMSWKDWYKWHLKQYEEARFASDKLKWLYIAKTKLLSSKIHCFAQIAPMNLALANLQTKISLLESYLTTKTEQAQICN